MFRLCLFCALVAGTAAAQIRSFSIGGSGLDQPVAIRADSRGNTYVSGTTYSPDFPATNSPSRTASQIASKVFVVKFGPSGTVEFSLVIGGSSADVGRGLALDRAGNVYVTGWTQSEDFPVTKDALQPRLKISPALDRGYYAMDAFVLKLSSAGALVYSTFLGGERRDFGEAVAVDGDGNAYVTGRTGSYDFPATLGAFQKTSSIFGLTDDGAFVAKLNTSGSNLVWATYLCGSQYTFPRAIAVGPDLGPVVAGETSATDFPVRNAIQPVPGGATNYPTFGGDGFVSKLAADGSDLVFSTFLGGIGGDSIRAVAVDAGNSIYVSGTAGSVGIPSDVPQQIHGAVLARVSRSGEIARTPVGLTSTAVLAVAAAPSDPRVVYAGAAEGLFRSSDSGDTWSATALNQIGVGAIVIDPRNPDVVYAGSRAGAGGNHGGLWKSADGGQSFTRLPVGPDGIWPANYLAPDSFINFLLMDPRDPETLYLVFGFGGLGSGYEMPIYKTTDGGASWSTTGSGIRTTLVGLAIDPEDSSTLYAVTPGFFCCGFGGGVTLGAFLRSVDSGASFTTVTQEGNFPDLTIANGLIYSGNRVSADRGETWTAISLPGRIVAFDAERLYALTAQGQLFESSDRGASWNPVAAAAGIVCTAVAASPDALFLGSAVSNDAFLTRIDSSGGLLFTRYFGGAGYDAATSMAMESNGRVLVSGISTSADFPVADPVASFASGFDPRNGISFGTVNAFVTEFDSSGAVTFSTAAGLAISYPGVAVDVDAAGIIWTAAASTGSDVSVTRIDRTGTYGP